MYACMYACMHVCMYACMHVCIGMYEVLVAWGDGRATNEEGKSAEDASLRGIGSPACLAAASECQAADPAAQRLLDAVASLMPPGPVGAFAAAGGPDQSLEGVVTDWRGNEGFGYIQFQDGRRARVLRDAVLGAELRTGDAVVGDVAGDASSPGSWVAVNVRVAPSAAVEADLQRSLAAAVGSLMSSGALAGGQTLASLGHAVQGGEDAVVSEWNEAGGYGFLTTGDGRRAFIHRSMLGQLPGQGLAVGSTMRVTVKPDPRNPGKWTVDQVVAQPPGAPQGAAPPMGDTASGTVASWNEDGGYGFLDMEDGRRAYIHRSMFGGAGSLAVGSRLLVSTRPDSRNPGKLCVGEVLAGDIVDSGAGPPAKRARPG
ncbi:unnamed protein product [Prorocentrum cordatum]|uniref:CSD domain-containing protein n=2 Tax=Prorocentrum cordatum TaxID=2364126 RepID=A0ABN9QAU9_9DINO|nr:unnamed protein product [Polarella glacialis]